MTLKRLKFYNIQQHKKLVMEFDPICTTICGASRSGKSTVIRALRWITTNQPKGTSIVSFGETKCYASLTFDDRHKVTRKRSGASNTYLLDGKVFKAFKSGVPEPISELLAITDINFQHQLDPHFWLSLSPAQISKEINQIVNLEVIDQSLYNIASEIRKTKGRIEVCEERYQEAKKASEVLSWVPSMDERLRQLEEMHQEVEQKSLRINDLCSILSQSQKLESQRIDAIRRSKRIGAILLPINEIRQEIGNLERDYQLLNSLVNEGDRLWERRREALATQKELGKKMEDIMKDRCPLCGQKLKTPHNHQK